MRWREDDGEDAPPAREDAPLRPITVVIADDQRLLRTGFRVILDAEPDITVVGEAGDGRAAVDVVAPPAPRRGADGHPHARARRARGGRADPRRPRATTTAVVMLTTFDASEYVYDALRIGASGFLLKDTPADRLLDAVRVVAAGDALDRPLGSTRRLIERFRHARPAPRPTGVPAALGELTARELEVLRLVARGLSNAEIAARARDRREHGQDPRRRILSKLGLRDRVQAVVLAYDPGLVAPDTRPARALIAGL